MKIPEFELSLLLNLLKTETLFEELLEMDLITVLLLKQLAEEYIINRLSGQIKKALPSIIRKELPMTYNDIKGIPNDEYERSIYDFTQLLFDEEIAPSKSILRQSNGHPDHIRTDTEAEVRDMIENNVDLYKTYLESKKLDMDKLETLPDLDLIKYLQDYPKIREIIDMEEEDIEEIRFRSLNSEGHIVQAIRNAYHKIRSGIDLPPEGSEEFMFLLEYRYNQLHDLPLPTKGKIYFAYNKF